MSWPTMMFKVWANMEVDDATGRSVVSSDVWCPHCRNVGLVVMDAENVGRACPMCVLGAYQNVRWGAPMVTRNGVVQPVGAQRPQQWSWRPQDSPVGLSWENGLTFACTSMCGGCGRRPVVRGGVCDGCVGVGVAS